MSTPVIVPSRPDPLVLTPEQRAVLEPARQSPVTMVVGAPGTGKTTAAMELVAARVSTGALEADQAVVLAPTRSAAARVRESLTARLVSTSTAPTARTPSSLAFSILHRAALRERGLGATLPRLISGAEQDLILTELLRGHAAMGPKANAPDWPVFLRRALPTRGFRDQLRDLLMRAVEHGLSPADLAELGHRHDRPEWVASAAVFAEYDEVTALGRPGAYDPAWICRAAAELLREPGGPADEVRDRIRLLVIDDAQELTASAADLVLALAGPQTEVVLLGDGDVTVEGFRGAEPSRMESLAQALAQSRIRAKARDASATAGVQAGPGSPRRITLRTGHRLPVRIAEAAGAVVTRIGVSTGVDHRRPAPARGGGAARVVLGSTATQENAAVADQLRRWHVLDGVPYDQMAVISRSRTRQEALRRALAGAEVPVVLPGGGVHLAEQPAVRTLLLAYEVALRTSDHRVAPDGTPLGRVDVHEAEVLLTSPLGGADPATLRRIRLRAAAWARAMSDPDQPDRGGLDGPALIAAAIEDPHRIAATSELAGWGADATPLLRVARVLAAGTDARQGTAEDLLWALWSASGLSDAWERTALGGGVAAERAHRDLDAVLTLFKAAEQFVERMAGAGPEQFVDHVRAQQIAADSLVDRVRPGRSVELLTPQTAAGRQWRRVIVVGVQDGVWPDLRVRDTLLGAQHLVDVLLGRAQESDTPVAARARVRTDELRQFYTALTRASEEVVITAVESEQDRPSPFLALTGIEAQPIDVDTSLTLRGAVAMLRRDLVLAHRGGDAPRQRAVADALAYLADHRVPGADPGQWWSAQEVSALTPLYPPGQVRLSPSTLQGYSECALRWLLSTRGGQDPGDGTAAAIGTTIHEVIAQDPNAQPEDLIEELHRQWPADLVGSGWTGRRHLSEAEQMLWNYDRYRRAAAESGWAQARIEQEYRTEVAGATITARIDRVEQNAAGQVRVVDLKTGRTVLSRADAERNPQLGVYQVAVGAGAPEGDADARVDGDANAHASAPGASGGGADVVGAQLVYLTKTGKAGVRTQVEVARSEDPRWVDTLIATAAEGMTGARFEATPGAWCRTCSVVASCPVGQEDGPADRPDGTVGREGSQDGVVAAEASGSAQMAEPR